MGMFWDLMQDSSLYEQEEQVSSLEQRVVRLERNAAETRRLLRTLLETLEREYGRDLDRDGRVG